MTFTSRYPGHCHADCTPRPERPVTVCPTCHLTKPCDCEPAKEPF